MNIYIVEIHYEYEGSEVVGVYSSLKDARKHREAGGDYMSITRWQVDGDASNAVALPLVDGKKAEGGGK